MSRYGRLSRNRMAVLAGVAGCVVLAQGLGAFGAAGGPPAPRITDAPLRPTISTTATFAFSGPGARFECALDAAAYRTCVTPATFRGLALGDHRFRVRARDVAGAAGDAAAYTWQIIAPHPRPLPSGVVPRPVMTTVPIKPWISRSATFGWILRGAVSSQCSLDQSAWRGCASPKTYSGLRLGQHLFRVRAQHGGRSSRTNQFTWTITSGLPPAAPTINAAPSASTTSTDAIFAFTVASGDAFQCRLDVSGWQQCSNPAIYVGFGAGMHTFCVRAVKRNGIAGPESCVTWMVYSPPPGEPAPPTAGAFTISGDLPSTLSPGVGATLPLTITNPLTIDLTVTDVVVTALPDSGRPGCDGAANLTVTQSSLAGGSVSIVVPAAGSVTLPAQGATAPIVLMQNLPVNQDACKGAVFSLSYSGMGSG